MKRCGWLWAREGSVLVFLSVEKCASAVCFSHDRDGALLEQVATGVVAVSYHAGVCLEKVCLCFSCKYGGGYDGKFWRRSTFELVRRV